MKTLSYLKIISLLAVSLLLFLALACQNPDVSIHSKDELLSYISENMVLVEGDSFNIENNFTRGWKGEEPVKRVELNSFYISKYEVTFAEYDFYCQSTSTEKTNDEGWGRGRRPLIYVNWFDALKYCNWLSGQEGMEAVYQIDGSRVKVDWLAKGYRLPTEVEWEYAAKEGFWNYEYDYSGSQKLDKIGWYWKNSREKTHPVGKKKPNKLGLYDMNGNVSEWCWDRYDLYFPSSVYNPKGPDSGLLRVIRGGSWYGGPFDLPLVHRNSDYPEEENNLIGFRIVRNP